MALSSRSLESTFDDFLEALQAAPLKSNEVAATPATPASQWSPARGSAVPGSASPFASFLQAAQERKNAAPLYGSPAWAEPERQDERETTRQRDRDREERETERQRHRDTVFLSRSIASRTASPQSAQRSFSVRDVPESPQISRRSSGSVRLDFDPVEKLRDLTAVVNQQQSTISALQMRIETGLQSLGADLRDALRDTATQERLKEVEKEMQQWSRRWTDGDAERSMRVDAVAERCQHALFSTSRHQSQLSEVERRLGALEAELPQQARKQRESEQQLEAQTRSLLDRLTASGPR